MDIWLNKIIPGIIRILLFVSVGVFGACGGVLFGISLLTLSFTQGTVKTPAAVLLLFGSACGDTVVGVDEVDVSNTGVVIFHSGSTAHCQVVGVILFILIIILH